MPEIHIIGGGTVFHARPHMALCAPAYGSAARMIYDLVPVCFEGTWGVELHLTRMAGGPFLETNEHISDLVDRIVADPQSKVVFMTAALCDFDVSSIREQYPQGHAYSFTDIGKEHSRLQTSRYKPSGQLELQLGLTPSSKIINKIRKNRKDIFLVGFKTTSGADGDEQFAAGLKLMKESSCNLVLANDLKTRVNMVITPEQARYGVTVNRRDALAELVEMAGARCNGTFTRSTVKNGDIVPWTSKEIPEALRHVVNHCISRGAYRPFMGKTVGHFAAKVGENRYLTSIRKSDFNELAANPATNGLVRVEARGDDEIISYGAKPSVGGQSQRIIFAEHPDLDCIAHAHVQLRPGSNVPVRPQWQHECGSHQCGQNTSSGLKEMEPGIWAVMLEKHGFNVVFRSDIDSRRVVDFIEKNFDLERQTSELS